MRTASVKLASVTPYSSSAPISSEKGAKEGHQDFEERVWRERLTVDSSGQGVILGIAFKKALDQAASRFPEKIKGRQNTTYTKFMVAGITVAENLPLIGVTRENVKGERLFVPSDGKAGSGKRVWKVFPVVHKWSGVVDFTIFDDTITETVFENTIQQAMAFVGVGRWRPERGGMYGRAAIEGISWK